jgi:hypothetical protein
MPLMRGNFFKKASVNSSGIFTGFAWFSQATLLAFLFLTGNITLLYYFITG